MKVNPNRERAREQMKKYPSVVKFLYHTKNFPWYKVLSYIRVRPITKDMKEEVHKFAGKKGKRPKGLKYKRK